MAEPAKTKRAIQRIMRDDQGRLAYILIDLDTMQPVRDPKDYRIINQFSSHVEEVTDVTQPDKPKSEEAKARQAQVDRSHTDSNASDASGNFAGGTDRSSYTTSGRDGSRSSSSVRNSTVNRSGSTRSTRSIQPTRDAFSDPGTQLDAREKGFGSPTRTEKTRRSFVDTVGPVSSKGTPSGDIDYAHPERGSWTKGVTQETQDVANRLSGAVGGVNMTSAHRDPKTNKAIGGAKKSAHIEGQAFDISTKGMTDEEKQRTVEMGRLAGANRVGTYLDGSLHFDTKTGFANLDKPGAIETPDGTYGMYNRTAIDAAKNAPGWFTRGMTQDTFAPTPFSADEVNPNENKMRPSEETVAQKTISNVKESLAPTNNRQSQFTAEDLANFTPAQAAYYGYTKPTAQAKTLAAKTLAGELSPQTREAAIAGDETALSHVGSILSVIDNRANSVMHNNAMSAITSPSMFSAFNPDNIKTTAANYSAVGPQVNSLVEQYYSQDPRMKPPSFNYTHYYNPQIANPSWGGLLKESTDLLDHRFGRLENEYKPNQTWKDSWNNAVKTQFQDYSGSSFANRPGTTPNLDSPIEKSGARGGLANMPGGSNYGGRHVGGAGSSPNSFAGGFSTQGGSKDPSAPGGRVDRGEKGWGGSPSGSTGGVKSDTSSYGGGPVDRAEKGWGGKSSSSSSGGGVKTDKSSSPGGPVDKAEKGW